MSLTYRIELIPADLDRIRAWSNRRAFSTPWNSIAPWNWLTSLKEGPASGYHFVFAEQDGRVVGYACYGPIALTVGSYDLYWIAVNKSAQGLGLGRKIMDKVSEIIRGEGGRNIYIETSTRPHYQATRAFYERCSCPLVATLDDFYAPGDGKAIYCKRV